MNRGKLLQLQIATQCCLKGVREMRNSRRLISLLMMCSLILLVTSLAALAASVPRMTTDELKAHLGDSDYVVLDARHGTDWSGATEKISGAERVEPGNVEQWASNYDREKTIVLYCS